MKELKDYLHLYLGCEIDVSGQREILDSVAKSGQIETLFRGHLRNYRDLSDEDIAPILRPLSDMTEEEEGKIKCSNWTGMQHGEWEYTIESFRFLLSKHFDLFGLIESGLAIDKTTLKEKI